MSQRKSGNQGMVPGGEPVVEDESLPTMDAVESESVMGGAVTPGAGGYMDEPAPDGGGDGADYPDMEPPEETDRPGAATAGAAAFEASDYGEGYVKLAVHVSRRSMEVVDAAVVDGPLVTEPDLTGEMVYQATVGGRRVAAEAFSDLGQAIGFAPPDEPERGHHIAELEEFDFNVRIPRGDLALDELPALEIQLLRVSTTTQLSEDLPSHPGETLENAAARAGIEVPEVIASMSGLDIEQLPAAAADSLRSKLR